MAFEHEDLKAAEERFRKEQGYSKSQFRQLKEKVCLIPFRTRTDSVLLCLLSTLLVVFAWGQS